MSMAMPEDDSLLAQFTWPLDAWVRGFSLRITDAAGMPLAPLPLHHFNVVNYDRRELMYPFVQRLMSFSKETDAVALPATVGSPLTAGQHLGFYVMWRNESGRPMDGLYLTMTMRWMPMRRSASPMTVFPFHVDVHHVVLGYDTFDVPPGGCIQTAEFSVPTDGHLLAAGGHLHDHGVSLRLEDATTHAALVVLMARRDARGAVLGVSRKLLGVWTPGPHLRANRRYRLVVTYDNPTSDTARAAMGILAGLFAPDDPSRWPAIDPANAEWQLELARLGVGGAKHQSVLP